MIKVNYNTKTTLVQGYYPDTINYPSIPEPFIEINESEQVLDKQMCVVNGVYQEYVKPLEIQLQEAKDAKIAQLEANRDASLSSPMVSIQAEEYGTENQVYFEFQTKSTGKSLTEPNTIIFRALSYPSVKYSCNIIEGSSKRKGYVEITKTVAENLSSHLQLRATTNIAHSNDLEEEIKACETLEDLDNINIEF